MSGIRGFAFVAALALSLVRGPAAAEPAAPVRLVHADWSSSVASSHLACAVIRERLGMPCELRRVDAEAMWELTAQGEADAFLSAWLPDTHAHYLAQFGDRLSDLGPNLEGTRTGLVVPAVSAGRQTGGLGMRTRPYVTVDSIPALAAHREALSGRIVGIDPKAGIMRATEEALHVYGLEGFRLIPGSETAMTDALADAIGRQEWIVVTGWTPHWMFGRWSLRFLDDPQNVYGGTGSIHTMTRPGLEVERPEVQQFLDRFHWTPEEMNRLMVWIASDPLGDPYAQALRWMRTHPERVSSWLE
jgi:glycine betaine/proline transport system substrate-binding protein